MNQTGFPIIGIGASAGGIDAFRLFFENTRADCGMAFVVILHLPADRKSMLTEILARWTSMPVLEVSGETTIHPNHVYVPPPHAIVTFEEGRLAVEMPPPGSDRVLRPIDAFFDSLGAVLRERAVGIVLSGTGSDGALGLKAIKECGGLTIAQGSDGSAPEYGEMPAGAIATGAVDLVAPAQDIPGHLLRLKDWGPTQPQPAPTLDVQRLEICELLRRQVGHDFSGYRSQTFLRRVDRRMHVVNAATISAYIERLKADPPELNHLFRDLLIRVTSFFRDKETFDFLAANVIPALFANRHAADTVRVWVPGCATGEEAYSLAILLREHLDTLTAAPKVQIFASDIDEAAIATARLGRYPKTLLEGMLPERRERFFSFSHGTYSIAREARELCTFSLHNLIRDPPFSMMGLVSCRNLLIYMDNGLQGRVIPVFHYSLIPGGTLLLGSSESVSQYPTLFEVVEKTARVFRRLPGPSPELKLQWHRPTSLPGESPRTKPDFSGRKDDQQGGSTFKRADDYHVRYRELLAEEPVDEATGVKLREALKSTCDELQSLSEEHQTALEELRSANEELHSVNEEIQSTNEELETSKEELQALNEELHTVNLRLTDKVEELDSANSDLQNLFNSTQIATIFLDRHLVIRSFTPAITSIYNLIPSDNGRPLTDIFGHLRYTSLREDVAFVLSTLEPLERRVDRDDRSILYIMRILPYREPDSTVSGVLVTFIDVTHIVKAEEALVEADVRKDVFLATLSHELRNPLAPIRVAGQLLQSPKLSADDLKRAQTIIGRQVMHMSSLLDDLLDVSRITRGSFLLKKAYVDLRVLIDDAVEAVRAALEAKRHTLRIDPPTDPITVEVDPVRITQVITNLLTNAVKYTPAEGMIHIGIVIGPQFLTVSVRDNGVGLTTEAMRHVFTMFTRIESDVGRVEGGLGIGLSLAKGLVQLHGGRIDVTSAGPGQGSEFLLCLPRAVIVEGRQSTAASLDKPRSAPQRILIADDNYDAADSLSMLLELDEHKVRIAHSGTEAFEMAKAAPPQVGIFDIGMPDLNGYDLAERVRREAWGKSILLIALTGWGQDSDRRRAVAAGFDHHVTKPVDPDKLQALIAAHQIDPALTR